MHKRKDIYHILPVIAPKRLFISFLSKNVDLQLIGMHIWKLDFSFPHNTLAKMKTAPLYHM